MTAQTRHSSALRARTWCVLVIATLLLVALGAGIPRAWADECPAGGEHDWQATLIQQATDDSDGLREFTCSKCGESFTQTIPATGHVWGAWTVLVEPTCTTPGQEYRVCTKYPDDPHYEYRDIPALSATGQHDYVETARVDATCTADGSITYTCSICGDSYTETLPALGHVWGDWTVVREPTATEEGERQRVCANDPSHVESEAIPATGEEPAQDGADASEPPAQSSSLVPSDFFTAGPDAVTVVLASSNLAAILIFLISSFGLLVQLAWIRRKRREAQEDALEKDREAIEK